MHDRQDLLRPAKDYLDFTQYTMLNYAFFDVDKDGNILGTDPWKDSLLLKGELDWTKTTTNLPDRTPPRAIEELLFRNEAGWEIFLNHSFKFNSSLVDRAHLWGIPVIASIGGPQFSDNFPSIAADPEKRKMFAISCVELLRENKIDGIEIHWVFPGLMEHNGTPEDKDNFTKLIKVVRNEIDEYGKDIKYDFLLTAAFGTTRSTMENIDWKSVSKYLDYLNIMTYEHNGSWGSRAIHYSPLFSTDEEKENSMHEACTKLIREFNVPSEKIIPGIAFFGRSLSFTTGNAKLYASTEIQGATGSNYLVDDHSIPYYQLVDSIHKYDEFWDEKAGVPYLISKDRSVFITYENEKSVKLKADYVSQHNLAGIAIWNLTGDYRVTKAGLIQGKLLTSVIKESLQPTLQKRIKKRWQ